MFLLSPILSPLIFGFHYFFFIRAREIPPVSRTCPLLYYCLTSVWPAGFLALLGSVFPFLHSVCSFGSVLYLVLFFCVHFHSPFNLFLFTNCVPFCVYIDLYESGISLLFFIPFGMPVLRFFAKITLLLHSWLLPVSCSSCLQCAPTSFSPHILHFLCVLISVAKNAWYALLLCSSSCLHSSSELFLLYFHLSLYPSISVAVFFISVLPLYFYIYVYFF